MSESKKGIWKLSTFVNGEEHRLIDGSVHNIHDVANDCDGDVLWDYMSDNGIIIDWDEYETDGDSESVAVMHKTGSKPDYSWQFAEYGPLGPDSSDCHTFS
jgi:hypothetical protein